MPFTSILSAEELGGTQWSIDIRMPQNHVRLHHRADALLRTASVGKLFLLWEVAERIVRGELDPATPLRRDSVEPVGDSGLWQHLDVDTLTVADAATLVGAVSDNLATNVLLAQVGLGAVQERARGFGASRLHDFVRDQRGSEHPPTLSEGSAADWARFFTLLADDDLGGVAVCSLLQGWLAHSADHSMVSAAFALDPLSHGGRAHPQLALYGKTGTDDGVRADTGLVRGPAGAVVFAVIANGSPDQERTAPVLEAMRALGGIVRMLACTGEPSR